MKRKASDSLYICLLGNGKAVTSMKLINQHIPYSINFEFAEGTTNPIFIPKTMQQMIAAKNKLNYLIIKENNNYSRCNAKFEEIVGEDTKILRYSWLTDVVFDSNGENFDTSGHLFFTNERENSKNEDVALLIEIKDTKEEEENKEEEADKIALIKKEKLVQSIKSSERVNCLSFLPSPISPLKEKGWTNLGYGFCAFSALDPSKIKSYSEIYAFDMDNTIICPKSGSKYAENENDWKFLFPSVKSKLQELVKNGKMVIFISNQNGVPEKNSHLQVQTKFANIVEKTSAQFAFYATEKNLFRKPRCGMLDYFLLHCNGGVAPEKIFYVGDAAGRPKQGKIFKRDHSCSDYEFALNAQATFFTPEAFFLGAKETIHVDTSIREHSNFNPSALLKIPVAPEQLPFYSEIMKNSQSAILFCGPPACGKSTSYQKYFKNDFEYINQDTLKKIDKCLSAAELELRAHKNIVVDSTNIDTATRKIWIDKIRSIDAKIKIFCVCYKIEKSLAFHLNRFRALTNPSRLLLDEILLHTYYKKYVEPKKEEGFDDIFHVSFAINLESDNKIHPLLLSWL